MKMAKELKTKKSQSENDTAFRKRFISVLLKAWMKMYPGGFDEGEMQGIVLTAKKIELVIYFTSASQREYLDMDTFKKGIRLLSQELKKSKRSRRKLPTIPE